MNPNLIANMTYKVSQRERAIGALFAVLGQLTLGSTLVKRNSALPERLSDHAMAILRDGEMGEPELTEGAAGIKSCVVPIVLHYSSASALG